MTGTGRDAGDPLGRRAFLRLLAGGAGTLLAARGAPGETPAEAGKGPGADPAEIRIGMSAAFKGATAEPGTDSYRGAAALYAELNANGGIGGRRIRVIAMDDGDDPLAALRNTASLVEMENLFILSNYVGTPALTGVLPLIRHYRDRGVLLVGNLSGAQLQRELPYSESVFNIRASYRAETRATVEELWRLGARRFGVFYEIDADGRSGTDGVARGLVLHDARIAAEATYRRGATFAESMSTQATHLKRAGVDVVLCTASDQPAAAFIRDARAAGLNVPISNVSLAGSEAVLRLLRQEGSRSGKDLTRRILGSQVVPSAEETSLACVREYRLLMDKWKPALPPELRDDAHQPGAYGAGSLEGFINAKVLAEGLRRAGPDLTPQALRQALESMNGFDLGIDAPLSFSPTSHQGLDRVYFTRVAEGRWVPLTDWQQVLTP